MFNKKLLLTGTIFILISLIFAGLLSCEVMAADQKLTIGAVAPLTGPSARVGEEFQGAVEMALTEIDYQIGDYEIDVIWIDSESETAAAASAYEMTIMRDGMDVGFLSWHSWVGVGLMDIGATHQIPHLFGYGSTVVINENYEEDPDFYSYWLGKGWPMPGDLTAGYVEAIEGAIEDGIWEPKNRRAAIYGDDTDWGRDFGAGIAAQLEEAGWEIVAEEFFGTEETDFYPLLDRFSRDEVSLLAGTVGSVDGFSAFISQADEIDLESMIIADGLGWTGEWYEMTGDASNYVLDQIPQWATEEAIAFREEFIDNFGFTPSPTAAALTYDYTNFLIKILNATLEEYGELNSEVIYEFAYDKLRSGEITYKDGIVMEELRYAEDVWPDPVVGQDAYMFPVIQYFEGEDFVVWPDDWAEKEIEIPERLR